MSAINEFNAKDQATLVRLSSKPAQRIADAMDAGAPAEGVTTGDRLVDPPPGRHCQARTYGITRTEQCPKIGVVLRPQWRSDEVVPAAVLPPTAVAL